jgi:hypothetical protein
MLALPCFLALALAGTDPAPERPLPFVRGDANQDLSVNITDALATLNLLFGEAAAAMDCLEAADANGDLAHGGAIDISDPVYVLVHLFAGRPPPPLPFPDCGNALSFAGCRNSPCPLPPACSTAVHGCIVEGVECPVFRADGGRVFELVRGDVDPPPVGWCGTVAGTECPECGSTCQQGLILKLCAAEPDSPFCSTEVHGCVVEGVECPVFEADGGRVFELVRGDVDPPPLGWCGTVAGTECLDCASFCQQGTALRVCRATADSNTPCRVRETGCMVKGLACPVFRTQDGRHLELLAGDVPAPEPGWCGEIAGVSCEDDCFTTCQLQEKVRLCETTP